MFRILGLNNSYGHGEYNEFTGGDGEGSGSIDSIYFESLYDRSLDIDWLVEDYKCFYYLG